MEGPSSCPHRGSPGKAGFDFGYWHFSDVTANETLHTLICYGKASGKASTKLTRSMPQIKFLGTRHASRNIGDYSRWLGAADCSHVWRQMMKMHVERP